MGKHTHDTDQWLLEQIAQSSESAFRELYDRYRERFYSATLKMVLSDTIAQEVVQELFIRIWNKREKLHAIEDPDAYLFMMAYRVMYTELRKIARQERLKSKVAAGSLLETNREELLDDTPLLKQQLEAALQNLPPQQQKIYRLAKQEGLSRDEIARQLELSPNTVRNHLAEAIRTLTRVLQKTGVWLIWEIFR